VKVVIGDVAADNETAPPVSWTHWKVKASPFGS
jgi:hypothetical protein